MTSLASVLSASVSSSRLAGKASTSPSSPVSACEAAQRSAIVSSMPQAARCSRAKAGSDNCRTIQPRASSGDFPMSIWRIVSSTRSGHPDVTRYSRLRRSGELKGDSYHDRSPSIDQRRAAMTAPG